MRKFLTAALCVVLLLLALSVWRQLDPSAQETLSTSFRNLWADLVQFLAHVVESLLHATRGV